MTERPPIPFDRVLLLLFAKIIEDAQYHELEYYDLEDFRSYDDPDEIRMKLANAIEEVAYLLGVPDTAENHGDLTDTVLEAYADLAEYLEETS